MTPSAGLIRREGNELVLTAPPAMPDSTWRALQQRLGTAVLASASQEEQRAMRWAVDRGAEARGVLSRWPAIGWEWDWELAATDAAEAAEALRDDLDALLDDHSGPPAPLLRGSGFIRVLLPAQEAAVAALLRAGSGGNFSVPGSGKTTMTYAGYAALRERGDVDRLLVIAPQSAYEAWQDEAVGCFADPPLVEIAPRSPRLDSEVVVVNYERIASGAARAALHRWARRRSVMIVFDEAHRAKRGEAGLHGAAARDIVALGTHRLALTGTPMPNSADDLVAVLDLAWPGHGTRLTSPHTLNADRAWVRITKDQLGLEPAAVTVEEVELDHNHRRIYDAVARGVVDASGNLTEPGRRAAVMRLLAAASNPALLLEEDPALLWSLGAESVADIGDLLADIGGTVRPAKLLAAAAGVERAVSAQKKVLVWTNFVGNVAELARLTAPYEPAVITGAIPRDDPSAPSDRVRELRRFREDEGCGVLIATPQTLGEGVSLHQVCQTQIHVDRTFNAGLYLQALDRTHRVGMPAGTHADVTVLIARGTLDEAVDTALREKLQAMDDVMADPTLRRLADTPTGPGDVLTETDLRRLVGHLRR